MQRQLTKAPITNDINQLTNLNVAKKEGVKAPHKPILLLSVIDLIDMGHICRNQVELSEELEEQFKRNWVRFAGNMEGFQPMIATPYWHMSNEPFWRLISNAGIELNKESFQGSPYSVNNLRKQIKHAEIDQELFSLLQDHTTRDQLCSLLISTYFDETYTDALIQIGANVKALREKHNLTQQDLADRCNFEASNLSRIEAGRSNVTIATLHKLATALSTPLKELL